MVIAGGVEFESGYMNELKKLSTNENVIFTGFTYGENLYQLYKNASLFVLASRNEGFPLVLLEAMKYGLDVLVSDIPATHLVTLDSVDYFKCGDAEELSEKISKKIKTTKKREYNLTDYDWDKIAKKVSMLFRMVIANEYD